MCFLLAEGATLNLKDGCSMQAVGGSYNTLVWVLEIVRGSTSRFSHIPPFSTPTPPIPTLITIRHHKPPAMSPAASHYHTRSNTECQSSIPSTRIIFPWAFFCLPRSATIPSGTVLSTHQSLAKAALHLFPHASLSQLRAYLQLLVRIYS